MNYAVELLGCPSLSPAEQVRAVRKFRVGLARYLGGSRNVSTFLAAFGIASGDDVESQSSSIVEAAIVYAAAHRMAADFAFSGKSPPEGAEFEVWPAH